MLGMILPEFSWTSCPLHLARWPLGWLNGRKADQYDVGFLMKTKISWAFAGSGPTVSPAARCIDVSRHPKMQKLLKAMPDVRRDYVRELDTALVESRAKPENRKAWKTQHFNCDTKTQDNTRYTRGWFLIYFPATNSFLWVSREWQFLGEARLCFEEVLAILMTSRCCVSRSKVPSRKPGDFIVVRSLQQNCKNNAHHQLHTKKSGDELWDACLQEQLMVVEDTYLMFMVFANDLFWSLFKDWEKPNSFGWFDQRDGVKDGILPFPSSGTSLHSWEDRRFVALCCPLANCRKFHFSKICRRQRHKGFLWQLGLHVYQNTMTMEGNLVGRKQDSGSQTVGALTNSNKFDILFIVFPRYTQYIIRIPYFFCLNWTMTCDAEWGSNQLEKWLACLQSTGHRHLKLLAPDAANRTGGKDWRSCRICKM